MAGREAVDLASAAGIELDPWEAAVLSESLNVGEEDRWSAFEVGVCCPRQNGKNEILLARQLAGMFLFNERLILHSAHLFDTSLEAFRRLKDVVEHTPDFSRRVKKNGIKNSHGEEGIELKGGQRIRFRTRTKGGGRGFTADCLILDEAMEIPEMMHGAVLPILSARPNPQVWLVGSAVDQWVHDNGVVFSRMRKRGIKGDDPSLAYFEWSVEGDDPESVGDAAADPDAWAIANPGLGIRISTEHIDNERRSMDSRTFAVERLGVGDWPDPESAGEEVIPMEKWAACGDIASEPKDPIAFAFDVTPDRSFTSIGVAGEREDGLHHIEVVDNRRGTGWVADRLADLVKTHKPSAVLCDGSGPAASLLAQLERLGVEVTVVTPKEHAQAAGSFYDACEQRTVRHLENPELTAAVRGAAKRSLGEAWAWSRNSSSVDISPLVACTLALWGVSTALQSKEPLIAWR